MCHCQAHQLLRHVHSTDADAAASAPYTATALRLTLRTLRGAVDATVEHFDNRACRHQARFISASLGRRLMPQLVEGTKSGGQLQDAARDPCLRDGIGGGSSGSAGVALSAERKL